MKIRLYQVDAFADRVFTGNPAAVCPLERWLDDAPLQAIAEENNLSETAFFVPSGAGFRLRWFTPLREIDLCGHATLAAAHVVFEHLGYAREVVVFETRSGELSVTRKGSLLQMDFPARVPEPCACPAMIADALGIQPVEVLAADDYLAVVESEEAVRAIAPDQALLQQLDLRGGLRQPVLRSEVWCAGRPGHRLRALRTCTLLGRQAGEKHPQSATALPARRHGHL
jgi:PhzF family phenazine biosynthesis protein